MLVGRRLHQHRRGRLLALIAAIAICAVPLGLGLGLSSAGAAVARPQARLAAGSTGDTTCQISSRSTTCTGTYGGGHAWDMTNWNSQTGHQVAAAPTVTVSPTTGLVNQVVDVKWANFTPTLNPSTFEPQPNANNGAATGASTSAPIELYPLAIYECRGTDPQGPVGDGTGQSQGGDCYDITDNSQLNAQFGQANGVYAFTAGNGTGEANILVEAGQENNSFLKCGVSSPCSLVVVPNWGGLVQTAATQGLPFKTDCSNHQADAGDAATEEIDMASYQYIGSTCSWDDRIIIPLSFAPTATDCPANTPSFYAVGSPGMEVAMNQWQAAWCTGKSAISFNYTSTDEYTARESFLTGGQALTASTDMALVSEPATSSDSNGANPSARHYTYAPLANSAVSFVYLIDNPSSGAPYTNLVLNARLAAKLLTQSYSLTYGCVGEKAQLSYTCDPNVAGNPATLFDDPEFLSENHLSADAVPADGAWPDTLYGSFLPLVTDANSDLTYEMTGWIASDSAAEQFLQGTREKDGSYSMVVNKAYKNIAYPASEFSVLDEGWSGPPASNVLQDDATMGVSWVPAGDYDLAAEDLGTYSATSDYPYVTCPANVSCKQGSTVGWKNAQVTGEYLGQNNMTGVLPYSDAAINLFPSFALVNAAGKAVAPSTASIEAAVSQMKTNPDGITQSANFASRDPNAYPLALVNYAMVPTCGLSAAKASAISAFLTDVATKGQTPGYLPGQLAPGYAPLNSHQLGQLKAAASTVATKGKQACPSGGGPSGPGSGGTGSGGTGSTGGGSKGGKGGTNPQTTAQLGKNKAHNAGYAVKDPFTAGLARLILPLLVIIGGLLGLGGPVAYVVGATGGWPALQQRIGALPHRIGALPRRAAGLVRGTRVRGS
jgi:hypothetical protein